MLMVDCVGGYWWVMIGFFRGFLGWFGDALLAGEAVLFRGVILRDDCNEW